MESKTVKFGILSTANIARKVIFAIKETKNCQVYAVASRNLEKAQTYADEHGIPRAFAT